MGIATDEPTMKCPFKHIEGENVVDGEYSHPHTDPKRHPKDFPCGDRGAAEGTIIVADAVKWACLKINEAYVKP